MKSKYMWKLQQLSMKDILFVLSFQGILVVLDFDIIYLKSTPFMVVEWELISQYEPCYILRVIYCRNLSPWQSPLSISFNFSLNPSLLLLKHLSILSQSSPFLKRRGWYSTPLTENIHTLSEVLPPSAIHFCCHDPWLISKNSLIATLLTSRLVNFFLS